MFEGGKDYGRNNYIFGYNYIKNNDYFKIQIALEGLTDTILEQLIEGITKL